MGKSKKLPITRYVPARRTNSFDISRKGWAGGGGVARSVLVLNCFRPLVESAVNGAIGGVVVVAIFLQNAVVGLIVGAQYHGPRIHVFLEPTLRTNLHGGVALALVNYWLATLINA